MATEVKKISEEWPVTAERYVAYIDIMGFKNMVATSTHEDMYEMMKSIHAARILNAGVKWGGNDNLVKTTSYSDSIIIYSKDNSQEARGSFISTVSAFTNDLFLNEIPHKGAVAYGKMTLDDDRSIFFGQPLIDAYLLQEELHFYGIIVHATAEAFITSVLPFIAKYKCPLKNANCNHYTIYPMHVDKRSLQSYPEKHKKVHASLNSMKLQTSGYLRKYIENTNEYFDFVFDNL